MTALSGVTLIVPTFNAGATVGTLLASLRREARSGTEIIVVDGASRDETRRRIEESGVAVAHLVSEPDRGIYDAINKGVRLASRELIGVLGADDELCEGALQAVSSAWRQGPTDLLAGRAYLARADGSAALRADEDYGPGALLSGIPFCHNAMFATAETYRKVGAYDLRYRLCADAQWVHRAIRQGCSCRQIEAPIVRFGHAGASSTNAEEIMRETYQIIRENFPALSPEDAACLFQAIRGWSDASGVGAVLQRHRADPELLLSAAAAFCSRARRLTPPGAAAPAPLLRRLRARWLPRLA
jgi:GT2 family glycosyltransferase